MFGANKPTGTIIQGRDMSERELFMWLQNNLGEARDAARGLAHARKDPRWLHVGKLLDECQQRTKALMQRPALHIFR